MAITLNHTIVHATGKRASAVFLAEILGVGAPSSYGPFEVVQVGATSLDFADDHAPRGVPASALRLPGQRGGVRRHLGPDHRTWTDVLGRPRPPAGRGDQPRGRWTRPLLADPDGHNLEILTVPYGGWG